MSSSDQEPSRPPEPAPETTSRRKLSFGSRGRTAALSAGLLIIGAVVGAGALRVAGGISRQASFVLQPSPIASMSEWTPAAIKGQVAEIFGNKFVVADASGRALVETGREGEGGRLVKPNETVTVQASLNAALSMPQSSSTRTAVPIWSARRRARRRMA